MIDPTKIFLEMDEVREWQLITDPQKNFMTLEVPKALVDEYLTAAAAFVTVQEKLEQLYRVERGLIPFLSPEIPEHVLLRNTQND